jgi:hypothetical protein
MRPDRYVQCTGALNSIEIQQPFLCFCPVHAGFRMVQFRSCFRFNAICAGAEGGEKDKGKKVFNAHVLHVGGMKMMHAVAQVLSVWSD